MLDKVMQGLRRPWMQDGSAQPYSQIEAILFLLLQGLRTGMPDGSLGQCRCWWAEAHPEKRARNREVAVHQLHNKGWPLALTRVLLSVLEPEQAPLALQWLSGVEGLTDSELKDLEIAEPLNENQVNELFKRLGPLATLIRTPLVLVLDQLELMRHPDHIAAFNTLLDRLIDESRNWLVVIGLREDTFDAWRQKLDPAILQRLRAMGDDGLPVVEVRPIGSAAQKRALLSGRLRWPPLADARQSLAIRSEVHPLEEVDLHQLASEEGQTARELLATASNRYAARTGAFERVEEVSLGEALDAVFRDVRGRLDPGGIVVERAEFADRLVEMVELYARVHKLGSVCLEKGPIEAQSPRATDRRLRAGQHELRVLAHNVQSRGTFPSFLRAIRDLPAGTILVRDGAVGIGGRATAELLREFKRDKAFVHLPRPSLADAYALGTVLAEEREGNYVHLKTEPPPTRENVMLALGRQDWFTQHPFAAALQQALTRASDTTAVHPAPVPSHPRRPGRAPLQPARPGRRAGDLAGAVTQEMQAAHWLMIERLLLRLSLRGQHVAMSELQSALLEAPLCDLVSRHPVDMTQADVQILIWQGDAADA